MVAVIGEALIDLVMDAPAGGDNDPTATTDPTAVPTYRAHPGGSPFNVAVGLARLGQPTQLLARLAGDAFGRQLRARAQSNDVDLTLAVDAGEPSTLAVVSLDDDGNAGYDFYREGTADWQWTAAELALLPDDTGWVHTGSLASWIEPGATVIADRLAALRPGSTVLSYDPNVRPRLMGEHAAAVARIEGLVARSTVVKASAEDLAWLYPGQPVAEVLSRWADSGPSLTVVTDGGAGAHVRLPDGTAFSVPPRPVTVVDTVGAGDAFMSGLIDALIRLGAPPAQLTAELAHAAVSSASLVAALTCARAGANPPTAAELAAVLAADGAATAPAQR